MKNAKLGDYIFWKGELAKIVGESEGKQVSIELLDDCKCPNCGHNLGKHQFQVILASPLFQESAKAIPTIK